MMHNGETVIFKCKSLEGHILKSLFELLHNHYKIVCFEVTDEKLKLRQMDDSTIIIFDVELHRQNFSLYHLTKPVNLCVHVDHLYKIIKNSKRNDAISFVILENQPCMLHIDIQKDNSTCSHSSLPMQEMQLEQIQLPISKSYSCQVNLSTKDFFKLIKDNVSISDKCKFECTAYSIQVISDNSGMYTKKIRFGEIQTDDNDVVVSNTFYTFNLNKLSKFSVLSHMFSIKISDSFPMFLSINVGHIGTLRIFMNSIEHDSNHFDTGNMFDKFVPYETPDKNTYITQNSSTSDFFVTGDPAPDDNEYEFEEIEIEEEVEVEENEEVEEGIVRGKDTEPHSMNGSDGE